MDEDILVDLRMIYLDRSNKIPLYIQIRESIRKLILDEKIPIGEQLPSESDLAILMGVSRMTVRQAFADLSKDGIIQRIHGLGTIVASKKVIRDYNRLTSFYEDAQRIGLNPSSKLIAREIIFASDDIAKSLSINPGDQVIHLTRLRYTETVIVSLNEVFVPLELCPWLMNEDLENQSLYSLYESHGIILETGLQRIEARNVAPEQAKLLSLKTGSAILYLERTTYTKNNVPIEWVMAYSPGGVYSLEMTLRRY